MRTFKRLTSVAGAVGAVLALGALTACQSPIFGTNDGRTTQQAAQDVQITQNVKDQLNSAPVYKFQGVDVKTFRNVVQLSGFVQTQEQKQKAQEIAQQVQGVAKVENAISLKPEQQQMSPTGRPFNQAPVITPTYPNDSGNNQQNQNPNFQNNQNQNPNSNFQNNPNNQNPNNENLNNNQSIPNDQNNPNNAPQNQNNTAPAGQ